MWPVAIIKVLVLTRPRAVGHNNFHSMIESAPQQQGITKLLILGRLHRLFFTTMAQQNQIKFFHLPVKRIAKPISGINTHCIRQPLNYAGATRRPLLELGQRVWPVRIDRNVGNEKVRVLMGQREYILEEFYQKALLDYEKFSLLLFYQET